MALTLSQNQNWNIGSAGGVCTICQCAMPPTTPCWAVLVENSADGIRAGETPFGRRNLCEACWAARQAEEPIPGVFSHWKTTVPEPQRKPKLLVDDHVLVDLFSRLGEGLEARNIRFRFVLALLLMRKRILRYEGSEILSPERRTELQIENPDAECWQMTLKGSPIEVINPVLTSAQIGEVSEQITGILAETI